MFLIHHDGMQVNKFFFKLINSVCSSNPKFSIFFADRGHINRAFKIINRFIDVDQKHGDPKIPDDIYGRLQDHANKMEKKDPGPSICVQFRNLWKGTFIWKRNLACVHFAISCYIVCYFGMLLNAKAFGRDRLQINTMLMGVAEICGIFIGTYFIMNKGRYKWRYTAIFNLVAAVISVCAWLVPTTSKPLFNSNFKNFFF